MPRIWSGTDQVAVNRSGFWVRKTVPSGRLYDQFRNWTVILTRLAHRASLTYISPMKTRLITVVETTMFLRQADKIWSDEERAALVDHMARNPEGGDVIPGTGGVRKIRWGRAGSGKRGGARVIYLSRSGSPAVPAARLRQGAGRRYEPGREEGGDRACGGDQGQG